MEKEHELNKENPEIAQHNSPVNWGLLAITWAPETPGSRSRALKIHIPA